METTLALSARVLIAEDDPFAAEAMKEFLTWSGFQVTVANDGLEALAALHAITADVLVTDLMMPRLDGNGLISEVWRHRPDLPIVAVTGDASRLGAEHREAVSSARMSLLVKPIPPTQLIRIIQSFLRDKYKQPSPMN